MNDWIIGYPPLVPTSDSPCQEMKFDTFLHQYPGSKNGHFSSPFFNLSHQVPKSWHFLCCIPHWCSALNRCSIKHCCKVTSGSWDGGKRGRVIFPFVLWSRRQQWFPNYHPLSTPTSFLQASNSPHTAHLHAQENLTLTLRLGCQRKAGSWLVESILCMYILALHWVHGTLVDPIKCHLFLHRCGYDNANCLWQPPCDHKGNQPGTKLSMRTEGPRDEGFGSLMPFLCCLS